MGQFIKAHEVLKMTRVPELELMDAEEVEFRYVQTAEEAVAQATRLRLDTNGFPSHWTGRMQAEVRLADEFEAAMKKAVFLTIERLAQNPEGYKNEAVGGSSVTHDRSMVPSEARVLLRKWARPRRIGRA